MTCILMSIFIFHRPFLVTRNPRELLFEIRAHSRSRSSISMTPNAADSLHRQSGLVPDMSMGLSSEPSPTLDVAEAEFNPRNEMPRSAADFCGGKRFSALSRLALSEDLLTARGKAGSAAITTRFNGNTRIIAFRISNNRLVHIFVLIIPVAAAKVTPVELIVPCRLCHF